MLNRFLPRFAVLMFVLCIKIVVGIVELGGCQSDEVSAVDVAADGSTFMIGTSPSLSFCGVTTHGKREASIVKTDPSGTVDYAKLIGSSSDDEGFGVAGLSNGGAILVGSTTGSLFFDAPPGMVEVDKPKPVALRGRSDYFIVKLAPNGDTLFSRQFDSTNNAKGKDEARDVAVSSDGRYVFVCGQMAILYRQIAFIAKHDITTGDRIWVQEVDGDGNGDGKEEGVALAAADGWVYMTGITDTKGGIHGRTQLGGKDFFIAKYKEGNGERVWTRQFGGKYYDGVTDMEVAKSDIDGRTYLYVVGITSGNITGAANIMHGGVADGFILAVDAATGSQPWAMMLGTALNDYAYGVGAADGSGPIYVTGYTTAKDFEDAEGTAIGEGDGFVQAYNRSNGVLLWSNIIQSTILSTGKKDTARDVAVIPTSGDAIVVGEAQGSFGTTKYGQSWAGNPQTNEMFMAKYRTDGREQSFGGPASVGFSFPSFEAIEGGKSPTIQVQRAGGQGVCNSVTVNYAIVQQGVSQTMTRALDGIDFVAAAGKLTIPAGSRYGEFEVQLLDDETIGENDKYVGLKITSVLGYVNIGVDNSLLIITDNDRANPNVAGTKESQNNLLYIGAGVAAGLIFLVIFVHFCGPIIKERARHSKMVRDILHLKEQEEERLEEDAYTHAILKSLSEAEKAVQGLKVSVPKPSDSRAMVHIPQEKVVYETGGQLGRAHGNTDRSIFTGALVAKANTSEFRTAANPHKEGEIDPCTEVAQLIIQQYPEIGEDDLDDIVEMAVRELRRLSRQEGFPLGDGEIEVLVQDVLKQVIGEEQEEEEQWHEPEEEYDEDLAMAIALSKSNHNQLNRSRSFRGKGDRTGSNRWEKQLNSPRHSPRPPQREPKPNRGTYSSSDDDDEEAKEDENRVSHRGRGRGTEGARITGHAYDSLESPRIAPGGSKTKSFGFGKPKQSKTKSFGKRDSFGKRGKAPPSISTGGGGLQKGSGLASGPPTGAGGKGMPRGTIAKGAGRNAVHPISTDADEAKRMSPHYVPSPRPGGKSDMPAANMSNSEVVERNKQLARAILARRNMAGGKTKSMKLRKGMGEKGAPNIKSGAVSAPSAVSPKDPRNHPMLKPKSNKVQPEAAVTGPPIGARKSVPNDIV